VPAFFAAEIAATPHAHHSETLQQSQSVRVLLHATRSAARGGFSSGASAGASGPEAEASVSTGGGPDAISSARHQRDAGGHQED
jgi:hypothetical protein